MTIFYRLLRHGQAVAEGTTSSTLAVGTGPNVDVPLADTNADDVVVVAADSGNGELNVRVVGWCDGLHIDGRRIAPNEEVVVSPGAIATVALANVELEIRQGDRDPSWGEPLDGSSVDGPHQLTDPTDFAMPKPLSRKAGNRGDTGRVMPETLLAVQNEAASDATTLASGEEKMERGADGSSPFDSDVVDEILESGNHGSFGKAANDQRPLEPTERPLRGIGAPTSTPPLGSPPYRPGNTATGRLEIRQRSENGAAPIVVLELIGSLDATTTDEFMVVMSRMQSGGTKWVVLGFEGVDFVNSTGLGSLVRLAEQFEIDGGIVLVGVTRKVRTTFELLGLHTLIPIHNDMAEALEDVRKRQRDQISAHEAEIAQRDNLYIDPSGRDFRDATNLAIEDTEFAKQVGEDETIDTGASGEDAGDVTPSISDRDAFASASKPPMAGGASPKVYKAFDEEVEESTEPESLAEDFEDDTTDDVASPNERRGLDLFGSTSGTDRGAGVRRGHRPIERTARASKLGTTKPAPAQHDAHERVESKPSHLDSDAATSRHASGSRGTSRKRTPASAEESVAFEPPFKSEPSPPEISRAIPPLERKAIKIAADTNELATSARPEAHSAKPKPVAIPAGTTMKRKTTVRYYSRMNPDRNFPLLVLLTRPEIKVPELRRHAVTQKEGETSFAIKAGNPIVTVIPRFPGCLVVPDKLHVDVTPEQVELPFWITPQAVGSLPDARVEVWYEGRCINAIECPTSSRRQTTARVAATIGVLAPVFFSTFEATTGTTVQEQTRSLMQVNVPWFAEQVGGFTNLGLYAGGALIAGALLAWLLARPKESATPAQGFFDFKVEAKKRSRSKDERA